jgi:hypothetical protein
MKLYKSVSTGFYVRKGLIENAKNQHLDIRYQKKKKRFRTFPLFVMYHVIRVISNDVTNRTWIDVCRQKVKYMWSEPC